MRRAGLSGLRRHHAGGSARGGCHARVPDAKRRIRQPGLAACLRPARARAGRAGARAGRRPDWRPRGADGLDLGGHRIQQPGHPRHRTRGAGAIRGPAPAAHRHRPDRAQGGARSVPPSGAGRFPSQLSLAGPHSGSSIPSRCARRSARTRCWCPSCMPTTRSACCRTSRPSAPVAASTACRCTWMRRRVPARCRSISPRRPWTCCP